MRRYETITILDPDLSEEQRTNLCDRLQEEIARQNGLVVELDDWGGRRLAYEIKKKRRGHYIRLDYCGKGALVDELERLMRINDSFLKYMTVLLDGAVDVERIKAQLAAEEAQESAAGEEADKDREARTSERQSEETEAARQPVEEAQDPEKSDQDAQSPEQPAEKAPDTQEGTADTNKEE
jgi:small subunit ribosomal protein S6